MDNVFKDANFSFEEKRQIIKALVKTRDDFQGNRIRMSNRLSIKRDGSRQNKKSAQLDVMSIPQMKKVYENDKASEKELDDVIKSFLKGIPIYEEFLKNVKGLGPQLAAVIISSIDIVKATTPSKIWQYSGINPNLIKGKKVRVSGQDESGCDIKEIYKVDDMVRGDKLTKGFLCPYNEFLKKYLLGILADNLIIHKSSYSKFYYDYKARLEQSHKPISTRTDGMLWCETTSKHRHNAAKRFMIKRFIVDLYVNWRTLEGLEVRPPYEEEYLGIKHHFD